MNKAARRARPARQPDQAIEAQLAELEEMNYQALREAWLRWYQVEPPPRMSRKILMLGVGWKIQERAYGGLSNWAKRRLETIARSLEQGEAVPLERSVRLKPGTRLIREWHGETYTVLVTEAGFDWQGKTWRSLSVIAREITGQRWSGPRFFGLKSAKEKRRPTPSAAEGVPDAG